MKDIITTLASYNVKNNAKVNNFTGAPGTSGNGISDSVINIINAVIGVLGLIAVVVVILGGIQYMTSAGDPGKVKKAKDTILYGIIGLVICVLAFAIVNFVISKLGVAK